MVSMYFSIIPIGLHGLQDGSSAGALGALLRAAVSGERGPQGPEGV